MKPQDSLIRFYDRSCRPRGRRFVLFIALTFLALPSRAHASFLHGETLDTVANVIAWFAFIIVPPVLIGVFLLVHILPEKVAEKRTIRSSGLSSACACSRFASADCSGRSHGFGPTQSPFCTRWRTARMSMTRTANLPEKNPPPVNSNNSAPASRNSKRRLKEGRRNGSHPAWHLRVLRLAHFL